MKKNIIAKKMIGIKIGSSSLVGNDGSVDQFVIRSLATQVQKLHDLGYGVFIVTSGAVASARRHDGWSKNLRSAVGQLRLMNMYTDEFDKMGMIVAQALLTDREIEEQSSKSVIRLIKEGIKQKVVFVINANDAIDSEELRALDVCADNDKLFELICEKIGVDIAVIVFSEECFRDDCGKHISSVSICQMEKMLSHAKGSSEFGHGATGMETKIKVLCTLAKHKVQASLVSVKEDNFLLRAVEKEKNFGTIFKG